MPRVQSKRIRDWSWVAIMSIEEFLNFVNTEKIVFWDSSNKNSVTPKIKPDSGLQIKDVSKDLTS